MTADRAFRCPICGMSIPDHLTVKQVARGLGPGLSTIRGFIADGILTGVKVADQWYVCPCSVEAYIESCRVNRDVLAEAYDRRSA